MNKEKPAMSNPRSPGKTNKRTTASEEINVITQVTAEAERLKEQNSKLREEMDELRRKLEEMSADRDDRSAKTEQEEIDAEQRTRNARERGNQTREEEPMANPNNREYGNMIGNVRLPRGGWLTDPFAEISFKGREDGQNPIKFLKKFEKIAEYENIERRDQLHYFKKCMRGNASNWVEVNDPESIEEAKESFREYFWGDEQQARFRENLYTGKFKSEKGESMAEYVMNLARQAKFLEPPMSDHEIIRSVKRHFSSEIMREIRPSTVKTINELTTLLDEIEYEKRLLRQTRRQSAEESQTSAKKPYEIRQRTGIYRDSEPRRNYEQYQRYGPEKGYENFAAGNQRRRWPEENRGNRQASVRITELPNNEEEAENKRIVRYSRDADRSRQGADKPTTKAQVAKKHVTAVNVKRKRGSDEESSSEEENSDAASQMGEIENESAIASMRTEEILGEVEEVFYEDQEKIKTQKGPFVTAVFNKQKIRCLIDTGAQVSAMSKETYEQLKQDGIKMEIQPVEKIQLIGAFSKKTIKILFKTAIEFTVEKARFEQEILVVDKLIHDIVLGMDFICGHNASIQCGEDGIEVELESEDRNVILISAIMIEQEVPDITNCSAEEMDSFFGILNITEEEIEDGEEPLFTQKEIVEVFLSDEGNSEEESRSTRNRETDEKGEETKERLMEKIAEEEVGKNVAMLNIHGPFFGAKTEQKYALTMTDIRSQAKKTYYMPDKRLKTLTDIIANKYLKTERKPKVIITDRQGQFRNDKWRIFCGKMGIRTRTLNSTANPAVNTTKSPAGRSRYEIDLREEEQNIIAENKIIQEMKRQLETIQMRIPKKMEVTTSPVLQGTRIRSTDRRDSLKVRSDGDSEEEIQSRRGSENCNTTKEPENKRKTHKEPEIKRKREEEKENEEIHILKQPRYSEKGTRVSKDPAMTAENLKQKENRRGSVLRENGNKNILTDAEHRRGSEPEEEVRKSRDGRIQTDDTPERKPVQKRRINQEAFELMLRAKDILNERVPAKKMLARMQGSKCKVYLDEGGQCDIITTTCKERLEKENVEMEESIERELIPECIKEMEDMKVRMVKIKTTIDEKEVVIHPIVLFGRNDAIILGRGSKAKLTLLQKSWREQKLPFERSDEHIQLPEMTVDDREGQNEAMGTVQGPKTVKYASMSKFYNKLKKEKIESDTLDDTDQDSTNYKKEATLKEKKRDRDNNTDMQTNKTITNDSTDEIKIKERIKGRDDKQKEIKKSTEEEIDIENEQYETDETVNSNTNNNNNIRREHRHTSLITHVSRENNETDTDTRDTISSNERETLELDRQRLETSLIIAGQINTTNGLINTRSIQVDDRSLSTILIDGNMTDKACSEIGRGQACSGMVLSETRRGNIKTNANRRNSKNGVRKARDRVGASNRIKLRKLIDAAHDLVHKLTKFMRDAYGEETKRADALTNRLVRIRKAQRNRAHMRRKKKDTATEKQDAVAGEDKLDPDGGKNGTYTVVKERPKIVQHLVGTFVDRNINQVRTKESENEREERQQKIINLEDELSFEGPQGKDTESATRQKEGGTRSPVRKYIKHTVTDMQPREGSPVKKRRRLAQIPSSDDEDLGDEKGLQRNRISHNPLLEKVHSKYASNFEQTLEGGMRSVGPGSVSEIQRGPKKDEGDGTRDHPRACGRRMEIRQDLRRTLEHRRRVS